MLYFCYIFLIFFISSILGYFVEITFCSIESKKIVFNRGFLMGPYIPIFGVGTVLIGLFLARYRNDPFIFFWMTVILCSFVEYITSYVMEKLFQVRWWDYSHEPFNYNGRVCLKVSMLFGIAGLFLIYTYYPFLLRLLNHLSPFVLVLFSIFCFLVFITDLCFTTLALFRVKNNLKKFAGKDVTEEARREVLKLIHNHDFSLNRLLLAFPKSEKFNKQEFREFRRSVIEYRNERKEKRKRKKL
ncbi:MAG: putative ABC transporter permease [Bacilli bacterium]|nr:putative ABC transporter permease [Bacilli bacterium]